MNMLTPRFREVAARFTLPEAKQTPGFTKVEVAVHKRIHRIPSVTKLSEYFVVISFTQNFSGTSVLFKAR